MARRASRTEHLPTCPVLVRDLCLVPLAILAFAAPVRAQTVTGLVYDDATGDPVRAALVTLLTVDSTPLDSTRTDAAGRFVLPFAEAGRRHLSVVADGYRPWATELRLQADRSASVLVPLNRDPGVQVDTTRGVEAARTRRVPPTPDPGVQVESTRGGEQEEPVDVFGQAVERGTGVPVEGAEITLVGRGTRTLTSSAGRFTLLDVEPGEVSLRVEHLAFETREAALELEGGWAYQVRVELAETAIPLEGIEVTVRSRPFARLLQPAYERMDRGLGGHFLVEEDLANRGYPTIANSLQSLPSVRIPVSGGTPIIRDNCRPALFIDGVLVNKDYGTVGFPGSHQPIRPPDPLWGMSTFDAELIEVYLGAATLPGEFANLGVRCAVVVWTKRGGLE